MDKTLADLRKSYDRDELVEDRAANAPLEQFGRWMQQALDAKLEEPNAMTVATVGPEGRPSTRIVLIKGFDARGIVWYTNYASRKGRELETHPFAALQFHWVALERVVRIEGRVLRVDEAESDAYFASRPLASRIGAWASEQSTPIASRGPRGARDAGRARGRVRAEVRAQPTPPAALGRLSAGARLLGVLAGSTLAPA